jgi:hypothetical protein
MKTILFPFIAALGVVGTLGQPTTMRVKGNTLPPAGNNLIAIDVLLEPDRMMVVKANALNDRLRGDYPAGYSLDATHAPHVSMLQRFVRATDLDAVTAAVAKVLAAERPMDLQLTAKGIDYAMWAGVAVTVLLVERTPELMRLEEKIVDAVTPFSVSGGTAAAFVGADANAETVAYVETFVPKSSGQNYIPHVTAGVAREAFVKQLKAEPFQAFNFKSDGVAIYQLGNFGTASKKLWQSAASGTIAHLQIAAGSSGTARGSNTRCNSAETVQKRCRLTAL